LFVANVNMNRGAMLQHESDRCLPGLRSREVHSIGEMVRMQGQEHGTVLKVHSRRLLELKGTVGIGASLESVAIDPTPVEGTPDGVVFRILDAKCCPT
jgi:hypothetical protein